MDQGGLSSRQHAGGQPDEDLASVKLSHEEEQHNALLSGDDSGFDSDEYDIEKHHHGFSTDDEDDDQYRPRGSGLCATIAIVVLSLITFFAVCGVVIAYTTPNTPKEIINEPIDLPDIDIPVEADIPDVEIAPSPTADWPVTTSTWTFVGSSTAPPLESPTLVVELPEVTESPIASETQESYILDPTWDFQASPQTREYHWTISDVELNPDGIYRQMMVINGQFPGPLIECNEGDTISVVVHNEAVNATAIHWHGLFQNSTNHMDGTVGITQCPIAPGQTFTYEFKVADQSGSYWYHGHVGLQASDGLFGPLIIHTRDEARLQRLEYATDRVIMIQDHYHDLSGVLTMEYLSPGRENEEPIPNGALINGKNIRDCSLFSHRECDNSTASIPVINLMEGQSHRIRFINVGAFAEFQIQFDEHEFAVTEVDGTDVEPAFYHRLNIAAAQRYSIVIDANVESADSYWMRARMISHCFRGDRPVGYEEEIRAIVQYRPSVESFTVEATTPSSADWSESIEVTCKDMNATELIPVQAMAAPSEPNAYLYLRANFMIGNWQLDRGFFNDSSWRANPRSPTLYRAIDGLSTGNESFLPVTSATVNNEAFNLNREMVVQTTGVQTIDIAIQNFDDGTHPMHLHGHKFFVLGHGRGHFNPDLVYPTLDLTNPLRRDTATVDSYGWLLIRFVADNPGMWPLHCHNSWHTESGLLMQFLERSDIVQSWQIPEDAQKLCEAPGVELGMAPNDDIWFGFGIGD